MGSIVTQVLAPILLFFMMVVVGLDLTVRDFGRVARVPRAVLAGTLGQLVLLPLVTAVGVLALEPEPRIAAGIVLIVAAPGGGISNVFTLLAGANTALSVTLTALASVLAIVTMPAIMAAGFGGVLDAGTDLSVPLVPMIGQLFVLVLVPIAIGMRVRAYRPRLADRHGRRLRRIVLAAVAVVVVLGMSSDIRGLAEDAFAALPLALLWTASAMALGYLVGRLSALDAVDCFTLAIEYSVKNVGLAAIVALSSLERPDLAIFAAAYIAGGYPLAVAASVCFRRMYYGAVA